MTDRPHRFEVRRLFNLVGQTNAACTGNRL